MNEDLKQLLSTLMQTVGDILINDEKAQKRALFRLVTDEITQDRRLTTEYCKQGLKDNSTAIFTQKELNEMPREFRKVFLLHGCAVSCRKRTDKNCNSYELRYRKDGYNISASGQFLEIAKKRFIEKLKARKTVTVKYPTKFTDFALFFIENYHKKKVSEKENQKFKAYLKRDIAPFFKALRLKEITPTDCQQLIDKFIAKGYPRKAEDIKGIVNQVFNYAQKLNLIQINPIALIIYHKHERQHGKALSKEEEKLLLSSTAGTPYQSQFAIALYCGLRPNEFKTVEIKDGFIVAQNSKRKGGKIEFKKIPIMPMLKPYIAGFERFYGSNRIYERFKEILPNHRLYDLRTTFFNRCIEVGVIDAVRDSWLGHKTNTIKQSYTDISNELHTRESEKFVYFLP